MPQKSTPSGDSHRPEPPEKPGTPEILIMAVLSLLLLWAGFSNLPIPAEAREPLHGSASVDQPTADLPPVYYPNDPLIKQADALTEAYKLGAAETIYQEALRANPANAAAWNGLGKVAYGKTASSNQNIRNNLQTLYEKAIENFHKALRFQPGYVEARLNLAAVYMQQGRMGEAADEISRAMELSPGDSDVLLKKGEWLVRQDRYNEALPYLQRAVEQNPGNAWTHYYLGVAFANRNEADRALDQFNVAEYQAPANALTQYQKGLIYEQQGNTAAALESYRKSLLLKPELPEPRLRLSAHYEHRGDYAAALEQLKTLYETGTPSWEITDRIGKLSIASNQPEVAVKYYRTWLSEHPEDVYRAQSALSQAKTQVAKKRLRDNDLISHGEAKRYADQAIHYQPNNFEARMIDAGLAQEMKEPNTAPPDWEPNIVDAALQDPTFEPYHSYEKGELLLTRYQFDKAEDAFRNARRTGEGNRSEMVFGELFLNKGLPDLAQETFQLVQNKHPANASSALGMAKARKAKADSITLTITAKQQDRKKNLSAAISQLEEAVKLNAENGDAHLYLGELYERQHDYARAADHFYAYQQLQPEAARKASISQKIDKLKKKLIRQATPPKK